MKKNTLIIIVMHFFLSITTASGFNDQSEISTPDMAKCAAAAMKIDKDLWGKWYAATKDRYRIIYKEKAPEQVESYTHERIIDKRRELNSMGFDSKRSFKKYFEMNCLGEI